MLIRDQGHEVVRFVWSELDGRDALVTCPLPPSLRPSERAGVSRLPLTSPSVMPGTAAARRCGARVAHAHAIDRSITRSVINSAA